MSDMTESDETAPKTDSVKVTPPVSPSRAEAESSTLTEGIALCLSGGGYRAMLFHLGTLWRLNELAYLPKLDRVSSVSGGSIMAGILATSWRNLDFDSSGVAREFDAQVVKRTQALADKTIDIPAVLLGLLLPGGVGRRTTNAYRKLLFGGDTLQALPDRPTFVINATNTQSGVLWRFRKDYTWDYRVGQIKNPQFLLAEAVAASAGFPPILSPVVLKLKPGDFTPNTGTDLQYPPFTEKVALSDGGVYDNLGLETAWKTFRTVLISDAGGNLAPQGTPSHNWFSQLLRTMFIMDNQVLSLRKRTIIADYIAKTRLGAYWGIRSDIHDYKLPTYPLNCPFDETLKLANVATRLKHLPALTQERLINWGYAICDAGMRKHVNSSLPEPSGFPYPLAGVG
jgi:NTE family protein